MRIYTDATISVASYRVSSLHLSLARMYISLSMCDDDSGSDGDGGVYTSCVYSVAFCSSVRPSGHPHTAANTTVSTARTIVASTIHTSMYVYICKYIYTYIRSYAYRSTYIRWNSMHVG